jgi:hypothetical protein
VRVAQDSMSMGDIRLKEAESLALADQALADFAAAEGIALPGASSAPIAEATKSMGSGDGVKN